MQRGELGLDGGGVEGREDLGEGQAEGVGEFGDRAIGLQEVDEEARGEVIGGFGCVHEPSVSTRGREARGDCACGARLRAGVSRR